PEVDLSLAALLKSPLFNLTEDDVFDIAAMRSIVAAHKDAKQKGEAQAQEKMAGLTAGLPLPPGMKLPF
ncbi:YbaB/EbfC family nucleoid-associated protein, partial [Vibrio cholerae]